MSQKLKSNMRIFKNGLITFKRDKKLHFTNKMVGLVRLMKSKIENHKTACFRKLKANGCVIHKNGTRIPRLNFDNNFSDSKKRRISHIFDFDNISPGEFETVLVGSFKDSYNKIMDLEMNPKKILGFMKLIGCIEKKFLLRKMDFWLPLKVNHLSENMSKQAKLKVPTSNRKVEEMQKFSNKLEQEKKSLDQVISKFISIRKVEESELSAEGFNEPLSARIKHFSGSLLSPPEKNFGFGFGDISAIEGDQSKAHSGLRNRAESFPTQQEGSPNEFGKVPEQR